MIDLNRLILFAAAVAGLLIASHQAGLIRRAPFTTKPFTAPPFTVTPAILADQPATAR